jgi:selenocysteine lyase/cysteine desulfurase
MVFMSRRLAYVGAMSQTQSQTQSQVQSRPESLQEYFAEFRRNIIGIEQVHDFAFGRKTIVYADWVASGRLYRPIEEFMANRVGPFVGNTHTESSLMGTTMTHLYSRAREQIKRHVNAAPTDVLIATGTGMTGAVNKLQRILGLRVPEQFQNSVERSGLEKPLVVVTHMEHHSNQTSWLTCYCDVVVLNRGRDGLPDLLHLEEVLQANRAREVKIGSFSAASNVTGIQAPIHEMAEIMHRYGGLCFADYAASAPYVEINMHPAKAEQKLDVIFFSPHKFLGGPGSAGVLIFDRALYRNKIPDQPGGGTVSWTNPWGEHRFIEDIEAREDGGTPGFLQTIRAGLAVLLKEKMGVENIQRREDELKELIFSRLAANSRIHVLENGLKRLGVISFYAHEMHYNLLVKLLNDRYGIQARGGCSCAGTYGHILLNVDQEQSRSITCKIDQGDLSEKPGWVRISLHPTMTDEEALYIAEAIQEIIANYFEWKKDYVFNSASAEFTHRSYVDPLPVQLREAF